MRIILSWLEEFIKFSEKEKEILPSLLINLGFEIEDIIRKDNETILDIGITPNRGDCLSILGIARELAAKLNKEITIERFNEDLFSNNNPPFFDVEVRENELCPYYSFRVIKGVSIGEDTPSYIKRRLELSGLASINSIVDLTNYIMLEFGQPLHAFDLDKIEGKKLIVGLAKTGEVFQSLNGKVYQLDNSALVITDSKNIQALAGIIGSSQSQITNLTNNLLIEAAYFIPSIVRASSQKLRLMTESSYRFERGIDWENIVTAQNKIAYLIKKLNKTAKISPLIRIINNNKLPTKTIEFSLLDIKKKVGIDIAREECIFILQRLGFKVLRIIGERLLLEVPTWRCHDIKIPQDLIEEIIRFIGYDKIPEVIPNLPKATKSKRERLINLMKSTMTSLGFYEVITYPFVHYKTPPLSALSLQNPLSEDMTYLRTTLLDTFLMATAKLNIAKNNTNLRLFEIGNIFYKSNNNLLLLEEEVYLGCLAIDAKVKRFWRGDLGKIDFYSFAEVLHLLFEQLNIKYRLESLSSEKKIDYLERYVSAKIISKENNTYIGLIGQIDPELVKKYKLPKESFYFELSLSKLEKLINLDNNKYYKKPSRYPPVCRDLSIIVKEEVTFSLIVEHIKKVASRYLEDIVLFDYYKGEQIERQDKSLSFSIYFRAEDRTLRDEFVNKLIEDILRELSKEFGAHLREA